MYIYIFFVCKFNKNTFFFISFKKYIKYLDKIFFAAAQSFVAEFIAWTTRYFMFSFALLYLFYQFLIFLSLFLSFLLFYYVILYHIHNIINQFDHKNKRKKNVLTLAHLFVSILLNMASCGVVSLLNIIFHVFFFNIYFYIFVFYFNFNLFPEYFSLVTRTLDSIN